jgi:signal transduction histidine kinase
MARRSSRTLLTKLLVGTLLPTVLALGGLGFLAHEVARRTLEDELGRRLETAAAAVALVVLPEQVRALRAGDEDTLTYANVTRKLALARERFGVRRIVVVATDLTGRGDTDGRLGLGAEAYELGADRAEIARARTGRAVASPLFIGHDGLPYKRGYAAIFPSSSSSPPPAASAAAGGDTAGFAVVEASADYLHALAAFRRWLFTASALTVAGVLIVIVFIARRITGPVARLAAAAERIGQGQLATAVPIETRDELGFLAATLDEMRAALQARDERLQMMLAGIAHEVRNPLGGLELYAGLLREALAGAPERLQEVARIEREVGYLKAVVNEFLDYARRPPLELADVRLQPLLDEVRDLVREGAAGDPEITISAPDIDAAVRADPVQLRRALLNLARNAVTAAATPSGQAADSAGSAGTTGARRQVVLGARRLDDGKVRIAVSDSGPGVPPAMRDQIFTPFFTTREKGTGLGLAFVREIVREHGADVTVTDAPGGGACFQFDLPAAPRAPSLATPDPRLAAARATEVS